ncbi:hypothetical protein BB050_03655 [Flavobacterium anhuiense]|jgi:hypothetical protein|uniref:Uncharacterized protein n=1 Tax=Flavobacterium anhuiense TaxID=459526 RepID=A0AAC9D7A0_9FLAO|nr:hypothetical protein BB050_03655 [Flavobacterium anhuiense]
MKNLPQKVRSRKLNSRVDLTAMVSVSFFADYIFYGCWGIIEIKNNGSRFT